MTTLADRIIGVQPMQYADLKIFMLRVRPIPTPKYQFSRSKWYESSVHVNTAEQLKEVMRWCHVQFGPHPKHEDAWSRWGQLGTRFKFRDEKDYVLFVLRWT